MARVGMARWGRTLYRKSAVVRNPILPGKRVELLTSFVAAHLFMTLCVIGVPAAGQGETLAPVWHLGDEWTYKEVDTTLSGMFFQFNSSMKVVGMETLVVNGTAVPTYRVAFRSGRDEGRPFPFIDGSVRWYRTSDLAEVRFLAGSGDWGWTYEPPFALLTFPLRPGAPRNVVATVHLSNGNVTERLATVEVKGLTEVDVPAGNFQAYEILALPYGQLQIADRYFYSPFVANFVRTEGIWGPDHVVVLAEANLTPDSEPPTIVILSILGTVTAAAELTLYFAFRRHRVGNSNPAR